jgi:hypothetical protein
MIEREASRLGTPSGPGRDTSKVVREQLERKRIDAFLPTITRWSRWKDRKKKSTGRCFPATVSRGSIRPTRCPS